jgi:hypothetical protein
MLSQTHALGLKTDTSRYEHFCSRAQYESLNLVQRTCIIPVVHLCRRQVSRGREQSSFVRMRAGACVYVC